MRQLYEERRVLQEARKLQEAREKLEGNSGPAVWAKLAQGSAAGN
jgi:hypothetical protein